VTIQQAVPVNVAFTEKISTMNYYYGLPDNNDDIPKRPSFTRCGFLSGRRNETDEMKEKQRINLEPMEGRTFILGREGHIYIDSPTASKHHAEIHIEDGKIFLRDLKSTNGTFLLKNKTLVPFQEGVVDPRQPIVIGKHAYVIQDLLAIASEFVATDDNITRLEMPEDWERSIANK
jgi:hypothetical protein